MIVQRLFREPVRVGIRRRRRSFRFPSIPATSWRAAPLTALRAAVLMDGKLGGNAEFSVPERDRRAFFFFNRI